MLRSSVGGIKSKLLARGDRYGVASDLTTNEAYDKVSRSTVMEVEAQIDTLFSRIVKAMNDVYCPNVESQEEITSVDGTVYPAGTKILDADNCARGVDGKLPPRELFTRVGVDRYTEVTGTV